METASDGLYGSPSARRAHRDWRFVVSGVLMAAAALRPAPRAPIYFALLGRKRWRLGIWSFQFASPE